MPDCFRVLGLASFVIVVFDLVIPSLGWRGVPVDVVITSWIPHKSEILAIFSSDCHIMLHLVFCDLVIRPFLRCSNDALVKHKRTNTVFSPQCVVFLQLVFVKLLQVPFWAWRRRIAGVRWRGRRNRVASWVIIVIRASTTIAILRASSFIVWTTTAEANYHSEKDYGRKATDTVSHFLVTACTLVIGSTFAVPVSDIALPGFDLAMLHANSLAATFPAPKLLVAVLIGQFVTWLTANIDLTQFIPTESRPLNIGHY